MTEGRRLGRLGKEKPLPEGMTVDGLVSEHVKELVGLSIEGCSGRDYEIASRMVRAVFRKYALEEWVLYFGQYSNQRPRMSSTRYHMQREEAIELLHATFPEYPPGDWYRKVAGE